MERTIKYFLGLSSVLLLIYFVAGVPRSVCSTSDVPSPEHFAPPDTEKIELPYPFEEGYDYPLSGEGNTGGLYLNNPSNITTEIVFDPATNSYIFVEKIGDMYYRPPKEMTFDEYMDYDWEKSLSDYWKEKSKQQSGGKRGLPSIRIGGETFDRIFGSNTIDIRPSGSAELIFGVMHSRRDDPALDVKQRRHANFDFQEKIQMNVLAKIGDKIEFGVNYNTEATFEFENKMKLQYEGKEDEIIQLIEAGDVTLPLTSSLITGSQSLFGLKTKLQFGRATVTSVFSQQKSQTSNITVSGGAQTDEFYLKADQYEENKHFFISQYFRDTYNSALKTIPVIGSAINITKIEVWVTNIGAATTENRNIVAFQDLGERAPFNPKISSSGNYPDDNSNNLLTLVDPAQIRDINSVSSYLTSGTYNFISGIDFEKVENAKKLQPTEYTFNSKLGFISLNQSLNNDQVLAVAYQYTVIGEDSVYQVGEFSTAGVAAPNSLIVKLLKSTALNTQIPLWNLMMKNVYSIGAYQVNPQDFRMNILYSDNENGVPTGYFSEGLAAGIPLIRVMGLDKVNTQLDPIPDGVFDFIDNAAIYGGTVQSSNGRIYFPVIEPFGKDLEAVFGSDTILAGKYVYKELYTMTKNGAQQFPEKNKFILEGFYKSSTTSEISLNAMNVPQGSVKVTAGGIPLTENVDYTVDYTLGRVRIINEGILNSGTPINISLESNTLFNIQTKTLFGTHVDYKVNNDFNLGFTILNLTERPLTQKVNFGDEPISNTIWGINANYQTESRWLTKMIDKLPFIDTKAPSTITFNGEFAHFIPGHSRAIGKSGTSYIDDFEGSKSSIDMKNIGTWFLASTPQGQTEPGMFPEAAMNTDLAYGLNRAKLSWYVIDPLFLRNNNVTPQHIKDDANQQSNHFVREILETEVFPNRESPNNQPTTIAVLNMAYYPSEKGHYNYDVASGSYSAGIDIDGNLLSPNTRWGGIMRKVETTDFEATNVEYIEFWVMDPFVYDKSHPGGDLYFNLGDVSEDVLRDGRKSYENGLPTSASVANVDTTVWGRVPELQALVNTFDNNPDSRKYQDVGLDGLGNDDERLFFDTTYLAKIANLYGTSSKAYQNASIDPSGDDYHYFRGSDYDANQTSILDRYKKYNGMEGNSPTSEQSPEDYPTSATTLPNIEDINRDNTLSETERYYQYRVQLRPDKMNIGENYITDYFDASVTLKNGNTETVRWYQFKIPVQTPDKVVGDLQDFKSIRFMRVFFKNFTQPVVCRFATLELVRGEWRKYRYALLSPGEYIPNDDNNLTTFDISAVNIEENGKRVPIPYVLPPDIDREINIGTTNLQKMNEQSLVLKTCNLMDGDARAAYKTTDFDMRQYKKLEMYVHAEKSDANATLNDGDLTLFVRLGTDFTTNYYEYEIPLTFTPWGVSASNVNAIWPGSNELDLQLDLLTDAKQERNVAMRQSGSSITLLTPYIKQDGNNRITIVGMPNLAEVKTIMIGIRNPKQDMMANGDDGMSKCAEVWVNELRLTEFDESSGWAAIARVNANLADLGNVIVAGNISTPGFGSIEKKVNERQKETITQYDFATNLELGKFLPEKAGAKIPMHFDYSETVSNPQYNPLNPDILFKEDLKTYEDQRQRDSIKHLAQDYTQRKSVNFMNVRKIKTSPGAKSRIYDFENFDFTYAYTEVYRRNVDIQYDEKRTYKGAVGYNFSASPKNVKPFSKIKFLAKSPLLALIKDFNFYYAPKMLSFRTDMDREYNETLMRSKSRAKLLIEPTYVKTFNWNRMYDIKFDLTQGLRFDFMAVAMARIDEPAGRIDKKDPDYKEKRDSIIDNILNLGRPTSYRHTFNADYTIPINKIPIINWLSATARYSAEYNWTAAPLAAEDLGNTIENSNTKQLNGNANFVNLYNKIPYFRKLNQQQRKFGTRRQTGRMPVEDEEQDTAKTKKSAEISKKIAEGFVRALMGIRNASISYSESNGRMLPGFLLKPGAVGNNWDKDAPGLGFVFGAQEDIKKKAIDNGWLSTDTLLNNAYMTKYMENIRARSLIEPLPDLRIELNANRNYLLTYTEYFKARPDGSFSDTIKNWTETGNFSFSYITWNTAFVKDDKNYSNENFEDFKGYLLKIAKRLAQNNPNWNEQYDDTTHFPEGYGPTSQDVLSAAFLAAYGGKNPDKISLNQFPKIPLPNWRITYTGLTKIEFLQQYFQNVSLAHAYRSSYNIGNFTSNILFKPDKDGFSTTTDDIGNFIPKYEIGQVTISEQFAPLLGIDVTFHNSLMSKFEIKKSRNLALSFANNQLTEVTTNEFVIGVGYRVKDFTIRYKSGGATRDVTSDLNLKADLSIRSNKTVLRKIVENYDQPSAGQKMYSINFSADYIINNRLNIRLFFDKVITNPYVSSQFYNSNTNAGISLRFMLAS